MSITTTVFTIRNHNRNYAKYYSIRISGYWMVYKCYIYRVFILSDVYPGTYRSIVRMSKYTFKYKELKDKIQFSYCGEAIFTIDKKLQGAVTMDTDMTSFYYEFQDPDNNLEMRDVYSINNGHVVLDTVIKVPLAREWFDQQFITVKTQVLT